MNYFTINSAKIIKTLLLLMSISVSTLAQQLIDKKATEETKALYLNLKKISEKGIMFGHQEDLAYGVGWNATTGRSDVKDVCGAYPAVHGWDLGKEGDENNIDHVSFANIKKWIVETYTRGGINTISWHVDNPSTKSNAWDTTGNAVKNILPGGKDHAGFKLRLDKVADFLSTLKSGNTYIPIIFRPYHEHNGNWFWWGKGPSIEQDYIALWKFTIDYLKNEKGLHHLIYAFSPDRSRMDMNNAAASYLYGYPGDTYVDILGFDNYMDVGITWNKKSKEEQRADFIKGLETISNLAKEKNKVAACTETGLEGVTNPDWYTQVVLEPLKSTPTIKLAYILVWRNANDKHHYAPYPEHASVEDFVKFYKDDYTLFENDIPNVYKSGTKLKK
jgi:mannan endo-1,4-beta-mannosidase